MTRGRVVLVALVVVVLGIGALPFVIGGHGGSPPSTHPSATAPRTGPQPLVWSSFAGLLLQHPASWLAFQSEEGPLTSGPSQLIGDLTDQVVDTPECSTSASTTSCHGLVNHIAPGGIVVTITTAALTPAIKGKATIAGHPAVVARSAATNCADDATVRAYDVAAEIQTSLPTRGNSSVTRTVVDACVADPVSAETRQSIDRMLATARL